VAGYADARQKVEEQALALREKLAAAHPGNPVARRNLMTSLRRMGDGYVDRRKFAVARDWYTKARAVAKQAGDGPLFRAEIDRVAEKQALCEAFAVGLRNPAAVVERYTPEVRAWALAALVAEHVRVLEPVSGMRAAGLLADHARGADDLYAAARGYASCAAVVRNQANQKDAEEGALTCLTRAADLGFRDADELADRVWDPCRARPEFRAAEAKVKAYPPLAPAPRAR
jgi:hypothetical protein